MRKLIVLFLSFFLISLGAFSQKISDDQIITYVMEAQSRGDSQQKIVSELLKKGATMDQLKRLKDNYNKGEGSISTGTGSIENNTDRTRKTLTKDDYAELLGEKPSEENFGLGEEEEENESNERFVDEGKKVFGRNIFNNRELTFEPNLGVATPLEYQLGPGDEVIIDIWGASQTIIREIISPDGTIIVENLGPVYLNGITVKEANNYLKKEFSKIYSGIAGDNPISQISLTLGNVRTIQVNIMGEVRIPGTYTLSSFSSVFHALYQAEGMNEIGSLRNIKVYRGGKLISVLDIYEYLLEGKMSGDIHLKDNDVILVDPYENLVSLEGKVKRPMYYEIKNGENLEMLLKYAGGFTGDAYTKNLRLIRKSGKDYQIYNINEEEFRFFTLMDEDSINVEPVLARFSNRAEIKGAVFRPGMYQMDGNINTLKKLIEAAEGVKEDAFLNRGILHRENSDLTLEAIAVDIEGLLRGTIPDISLRKNDVFFVPSINELQEMRTLTIYGEIARPGIYPYANNTTLEDLVLQSGGLLEAASTVKVDVSRRIKNPNATVTDDIIAKTYSFSLIDGFVVNGEVGFTLEPFDEVYVRRSPGYQHQQNVFVDGEVLFGGTYSLTRKNQRLSEVIRDAGGLTPEAYAKGARLERRLTFEEKERLENFIKTANAAAGGEQLSTNVLELEDYYLVGIELDKALQYPGSDMDVILKEGDRIIIPQYESTVKINGAVMYPNTVSYKGGKSKKYYVNMAGGYALKAKKSRAYVIHMNGTVARLKSGNSNAIQPGSEIIIPTKQPKMGVAEWIGVSTSAIQMTTMIATLANLFK